jgi:hypothetical protein
MTVAEQEDYVKPDSKLLIYMTGQRLNDWQEKQVVKQIYEGQEHGECNGYSFLVRPCFEEKGYYYCSLSSSDNSHWIGTRVKPKKNNPWKKAVEAKRRMMEEEE